MCHGTSQIWNFQNYTLDWQRKGHLLFYHNVGGNCFRKENASFLTCMALASPKTLRLKDLVNFVSISSWWATWNMASLKILGKKVLKSQNSEDEEDADEVVGCSSGIFIYISQPRWQRNIVQCPMSSSSFHLFLVFIFVLSPILDFVSVHIL